VDRAREDAQQVERTEVAERVRAAILASGRTAAEFAAEVGTSASRLSTYASGRVMPSAAMLLRVERVATELADT
jgi:transcriptional regulator with XRE-family HTH domain